MTLICGICASKNKLKEQLKWSAFPYSYLLNEYHKLPKPTLILVHKELPFDANIAKIF